jgi:methyltransferase (TIGR00027 family)
MGHYCDNVTDVSSTTSSHGFGPGQPSRTSIVVAALRAFGSREPDPSVRNPDFLAERLLGSGELQLISEHPVAGALKEDYAKGRSNREVAGMSNLILIRTRFIDDHMRRALEMGATQLVLLGAGFDTRAYRCAELLKDKRVFEVDYGSTQRLKKSRVEETLGSFPSHVRFAEIDFKRDQLRDVLGAAGYKPAEKTFFIWEGVSMYLTEQAVRETLRTIGTYSAPGSSLVMDFAGRATIDLLEKFPHIPQHNYTTAWGEPWIFGVPDMREREFFLECGLELRETVTFFGREAARRYLTRADGTRLGAVRGGRPRLALWTVLRLMWMFFTRRSKWYAVAELVVPPSGRLLFS